MLLDVECSSLSTVAPGRADQGDARRLGATACGQRGVWRGVRFVSLGPPSWVGKTRVEALRWAEIRTDDGVAQDLRQKFDERARKPICEDMQGFSRDSLTTSRCQWVLNQRRSASKL
jgi:hypothetical protein